MRSNLRFDIKIKMFAAFNIYILYFVFFFLGGGGGGGPVSFDKLI